MQSSEDASARFRNVYKFLEDQEAENLQRVELDEQGDPSSHLFSSLTPLTCVRTRKPHQNPT